MCVYVLIACSSKILCGIAQLDAGYVTVCSAERTKVFSHVECLGVGGQGCYIEWNPCTFHNDLFTDQNKWL